jgi:hypothetical protein
MHEPFSQLVAAALTDALEASASANGSGNGVVPRDTLPAGDEGALTV